MWGGQSVAHTDGEPARAAVLRSRLADVLALGVRGLAPPAAWAAAVDEDNPREVRRLSKCRAAFDLLKQDYERGSFNTQAFAETHRREGKKLVDTMERFKAYYTREDWWFEQMTRVVRCDPC